MTISTTMLKRNLLFSETPYRNFTIMCVNNQTTFRQHFNQQKKFMGSGDQENALHGIARNHREKMIVIDFLANNFEWNILNNGNKFSTGSNEFI